MGNYLVIDQDETIYQNGRTYVALMSTEDVFDVCEYDAGLLRSRIVELERMLEEANNRRANKDAQRERQAKAIKHVREWLAASPRDRVTEEGLGRLLDKLNV